MMSSSTVSPVSLLLVQVCTAVLVSCYSTLNTEAMSASRSSWLIGLAGVLALTGNRSTFVSVLVVGLGAVVG